MEKILCGRHNMSGPDSAIGIIYSNLFLSKKITMPITNPTAVISMFPFIRPPVTRPRDKENKATNRNHPLLKNYFPLY